MMSTQPPYQPDSAPEGFGQQDQPTWGQPQQGEQPAPQQAAWQPAPDATPQAPPPTGTPVSGFPAPGQANPAAAPANNKRGLLLGIGIPVAVLTILGILAATLAPGIILDRKAAAAAAAFTEQREKWNEAFSEESLQPYAEYDGQGLLSQIQTIYGASWHSSGFPTTTPDPSAFAALCSEAETLSTDAESLSDTKAPKLEKIEGGEANADYKAAVEQEKAEQSRYEASETLADEVTGALSDVNAVCAFMLSEIAITNKAAQNSPTLQAAFSVPSGTQETVTLGNGAQGTVTCSSSNGSGCLPVSDQSARAAAGDAWDVVFTELFSEYAALYANECPLDAFAEECKVGSEGFAAIAAASKTVSDALRGEDVLATIQSSGEVAPQYAAARDAFVAAIDDLDAKSEAASQQASGSTSMASSMYKLLRERMQTADQAIEAVQP